ncbi:PREDICTED: protein TPX2-like isoform X1 [Lupinus angustifolius]|uniref:protein TPX2-like isoform X1 n=1 Tax=Lupinus angustifolius TaxID=3871 RepID=UPI00092F43FE|nr:PREDICTED: protein TPX2-like isoform X1 [Lupinus angustifolius]
MMEEEDMEVENHVCVVHDIDFDYEFDASRFFDFCVQETASQALQAEVWFETAGSYPPSPFVTKLLLREENVNVQSGMVFSHTVSQNDGNGGGVIQNNAMQPLQVTSTGMTFSSKTITGGLSSKAKSAGRKCSTLLKPTASQLAKQNQPTQNVGSRFKKLPTQNKEMNLPISSGVENQAAKRQKLESGLLHKAGVIKQQTDFFHKAPKMVLNVEQNTGHSKLRITIPREPDLETAHRAQRTRPKNAAEAELVTVAASRFKARPLNRKILNAPTMPLHKRSTPRLPAFQEFHLKTSERAMQHTSATSSSSLHCNDSDEGFDKHHAVSTQENRTKDLRRPSAGGALKHDRLDFAYNFKARPLDKKIISSKGDIGVFRNRKLETTVPTEFNFHTEKRIQHNPPTDLFSKLSLASEVQSSNGSQLKLPQHSRAFGKDSKENRGTSFHLDQKEKKPFMLGGNQIHNGIHGCISEAGTLLGARR